MGIGGVSSDQIPESQEGRICRRCEEMGTYQGIQKENDFFLEAQARV